MEEEEEEEQMTQMYSLNFVVRAYIKKPPQQIWKSMLAKRHGYSICSFIININL